ncbi:MAG: hypothetical protein AAFU77_08025 [Myxococcota bacterium]
MTAAVAAEVEAMVFRTLVVAIALVGLAAPALAGEQPVSKVTQDDAYLDGVKKKLSQRQARRRALRAKLAAKQKQRAAVSVNERQLFTRALITPVDTGTAVAQAE